MYTFSFLGRVLAIWLLVASVVHAENLVNNPTFDDGIDDWQTTSDAEWMPAFGYDRGSLHLSSRTGTAAATQCIAIDSGRTYVASAHIDSHCAGARVLYMLWASTEDCSDTEVFSHSFFATSATAFDWELLAVTAPSPDAAHFIQIRLFNAATCADDVFFDDVSLQHDDIFYDGFDPHTID
jgi:hypothetical protein